MLNLSWFADEIEQLKRPEPADSVSNMNGMLETGLFLGKTTVSLNLFGKKNTLINF